MKPSLIDPIIKAALKEDVGANDITSSALIPHDLLIKAEIQVNAEGILCGMGVAERVFRLVDETLRFLPVAKDGELVEKGREIVYLEGSGSSILTAERTALNFLSHLSGIATKTHQFVENVKGTQAKILDTRKTTPCLRLLEKAAVIAGGGTNHRFGLYDQVLIKDNHLRILRDRTLLGILAQVKARVLNKTVVGLEVKNLKELSEALKFKMKLSYILLDNMSLSMMQEAVAMRNAAGSKVALEASGGVTLENVREIALTGVERISVGALTHDAPGLDISLDIVG